MLQFGKSITTPGDILQPLTVERLYHALIHPRQEFRDRIEQLRMIRSLDEAQYKQLKRQLPYFVCGIFHPAVRRKENLASIEYFMLDLDHLSRADIDLESLRDRLKEVQEVVLCFASPSADGLKLLFRLAQPCKDSAMYSAFYKLFSLRFGEKWGLLEVMDLQTSDPTRACFFSVDDRAFFQPFAPPIDMNAYLPDLDFDRSEKDLKEAEILLRPHSPSQKSENEQPGDEILKKIKEKLNPGGRSKKQPEYFVPQQVDDALVYLSEQLPNYEMALVETAPIQYGRKLKIQAGKLWAEINIFYGKQGFKVVKTTKTGSHPELAELAMNAVFEILHTF